MLINVGDVIDGALVNAIALTGRRVSVAVRGHRDRRRFDDLAVARWFETFRLTSETPGLPELSAALTQRLADVLRGDEVQAALQELLAARLTDAPEMDAAGAREALSLTLITADPGLGPAGDALAGYYDDQVCALVARLEAEDPPVLAQIRDEAFSARMISVLNAIERHTAALTARPGRRTESSFLTSYRRHATDQHGKMEPPDFDRRRRVPIKDIYVPTTITEDLFPERPLVSAAGEGPALTVYDLPGRLDRSVLLGDPGGGKTTAANVLMHHFALDAAGRIPFLVTLRDYAAADPPERSVAGHIEHTLETLYQCPAPAGLVEFLLLTGRAVVIFDGLDELLDTARRADVTTRVERFCAEYPLARVLVTSRLVGYDQARLDDRQFTCYRLGRLAEEQIDAFAGKWFAQDKEIGPAEAARWTAAFLAESEAAGDLRTNPLMLSLLCILYRGEGSLPRDRATVYEQCAMLMFRRWDARRRIHQDLRAGHLLEPALRHLAWWIYTRDDAQSEVTERELAQATAEFLQSRGGFESKDAAAEAAREFVGFCHGRMWVFSDAGTTAAGERLYAFTHRTFLEYFAAAQLAYDSDTPEQLADTITPHVVREDWWVVAELAIQIKDRTSKNGAQRVYADMIGNGEPNTDERRNNLRFLAQCLRSVDPSAPRVRELTRRIFEEIRADEQADISGGRLTGLEGTYHLLAIELPWGPVCHSLLANCGMHRDVVAHEIQASVADDTQSGDREVIVSSLRLMLSLPYAPAAPFDYDPARLDYWNAHAQETLRTHGTAVVGAARTDAYLRTIALEAGLISTRQALEMTAGPTVLFQMSESCFFNYKPYFTDALHALEHGWPAFGAPAIAEDLTAFGEYLIDHPETPWLEGVGGGLDDFNSMVDRHRTFFTGRAAPLSQAAYLGAAAMLLILEEISPGNINPKRRLGPLRHLAPYLTRRQGLGKRTELPNLMVPEQFKQTFRDWAEGRVSFTVQG